MSSDPLSIFGHKKENNLWPNGLEQVFFYHSILFQLKLKPTEQLASGLLKADIHLRFQRPFLH
jgi:hypothetical protein